MAVVSASTTLLLTGPTLRPPENIWDIAVPDAILTAEVIGIVNVIVMITSGKEIGTVTAIALPVASTETVVTGTRIGTGVIEGAPVATLPIGRGEEAYLAVQVTQAPDVLANVSVTAINPKILVVFCRRLPLSGMQAIIVSSCQVSRPFTVLYQDFKLKLFRQLA